MSIKPFAGTAPLQWRSPVVLSEAKDLALQQRLRSIRQVLPFASVRAA